MACSPGLRDKSGNSESQYTDLLPDNASDNGLNIAGSLQLDSEESATGWRRDDSLRLWLSSNEAWLLVSKSRSEPVLLASLINSTPSCIS